MLSVVATKRWKYIGNYIHLKSNSALVARFFTHKWKAKAEGLIELVEAIRNPLGKERLQTKWIWIL